jgi:hypothetical protein
VCGTLVDRLARAVEEESLTMEALKDIQTEVKSRVQRSSFSNTCVVYVAVINVVVVILFVLIAFDVYPALDTALLLPIYLKELIFVWIVF